MRRGLTGAVLAAAALAAAGCAAAPGSGSTALKETRPVASAAPAAKPATSPAPSAKPSAGAPVPAGVVMPPFGHGARVVADWKLPASRSQAGAVTTAENMALAILYTDYTSGQVQGWRAYSGNQQVTKYLAGGMNIPDITTRSWTGTLKLWNMSVVPAPYGPSTTLVSWCENDAATRNTSAAAHTVLPPDQQEQGDANYYLVSYVMIHNAAGKWSVAEIMANQNVQQAPQCRA